MCVLLPGVFCLLFFCVCGYFEKLGYWFERHGFTCFTDRNITTCWWSSIW